MSDQYREFIEFNDCPGQWERLLSGAHIAHTDAYQIRNDEIWRLENNDGREFLAVAYRQNRINSDLYLFAVLWLDDSPSDPKILYSELHGMTELEAEFGTRADAIEEVATWMSGKAYDIMKQHPSGYYGGQPSLDAFTDSN